ncbi:MAG: hypothetical protein HY438_02565 [DPANN group archaeon]|nr:hypothetical protein [DPANN group archaeon]
MTAERAFPKYPEAYRLVYQNLGTRSDKTYLTEPDVRALFSGEVVLEEKLDGSTLIVTWTGGKPLLRAKGARIISEFEKTKAFIHAYNWAYQNSEKLEKIPQGLAIVGEWLYAMHSIPYNELPDFFVAFDVIEKRSGRILPFEQKRRIIENCGLASAPVFVQHRIKHDEVPSYIGPSEFSGAHPEYETPFAEAQTIEGIVVKNYSSRFPNGLWSGKYITNEFTESFELHWLKKPLVKNKLKVWAKSQ